MVTLMTDDPYINVTRARDADKQTWRHKRHQSSDDGKRRGRKMTNHDQDGALVSMDDGRRIVEGRHRLFAIHMAACENSAKAARLAGYSDHRGTSKSTGSRLMQDPAVIAMVEEERQARAHRLRVSEERIVEAYAAIAFGDFRSVVRYHDGKVEIIPSDDLTDDEAMLVASVETRTRTDQDGNVTVTTRIKLEDRQRALEALARIKGMFCDRLEVEHGETGIVEEMAAIRQRRLLRSAASNAARPVDAGVIEIGQAAETVHAPAPTHDVGKDDVEAIAQRSQARKRRNEQ